MEEIKVLSVEVHDLRIFIWARNAKLDLFYSEVEGLMSPLIPHFEQGNYVSRDPATEIMQGRMVCAKMSDGRWLRCSVKHFDLRSQTLDLFWLDHGATSQCTIDQVRIIPKGCEQLIKIPATVQFYTLGEIVPAANSFTKEVLAYTSSELSYQYVTMQLLGNVRYNNSVFTQVRIFKEGSNFANSLVEHGFAKRETAVDLSIPPPGFSRQQANMHIPHQSQAAMQISHQSQATMQISHQPQAAMPIPHRPQAPMPISHQPQAAMPISHQPQSAMQVSLSPTMQHHMQVPLKNWQDTAVQANTSTLVNHLVRPNLSSPVQHAMEPVPSVMYSLQVNQMSSPQEPLIKWAEKETDYVSTKLSPNRRYYVHKISSAEGPHQFSVQLKENVGLMEELLVKLESLAKSNKLLSIKGKIGCPCLCHSSVHSSYARGFVVSELTGGCSVFMVDYGNMERKFWNEVFAIPLFLTNTIPMLSFRCSLQNYDSIPPDNRKFFEPLVLENDRLELTVEDDEKAFFEVNIYIDGYNVLTKLQNWGPKPKYERLKLTPGQKYAVRVYDVASRYGFHAQVEKDSYILEELKEKFVKHKELFSPLDPNQLSVDMACSIFLDGTFYRAEIIKISGSQCVVRLVDFGSTEVMAVEVIRNIPALAVKNYPVLSIHCRLEQSGEEETKESIADLVHKINRERFLAEIISYEEGMHTMRLYDRDKPQVPVQFQSDYSACVVREPTVTQIEKLNIQVYESKQHFYGQLMKFSEKKLKEQQFGLNRDYRDLSPGMLPLSPRALFGVTSFSEDGEMYRVKIQKDLGSDLEVFFIDYGNVEIKPRDQVFAIKPEYCSLPQQGILCTMGKSEYSDDDLRDAILDNDVEFYIDGDVKEKVAVRLTSSEFNSEIMKSLAPKKAGPVKTEKNFVHQEQTQWTVTESVEEKPKQQYKQTNTYERQNSHGGFKDQERGFQTPGRRTAKDFEQRKYQDDFRKPPQRRDDQHQRRDDQYQRRDDHYQRRDDQHQRRDDHYQRRDDHFQRRDDQYHRRDDHYQKKGSQRSRDGPVSGSGSSGSASSYAASLRELDITPGSYKEVEVVYLMSMKEFYIQPVEFSGDLNTLMDQIRRTYSGGGKRNKQNMNKGDACAALYANDNVWYRARVESVKGSNNVDVYFVDYGNRETVRSDSVQNLKTEFLALPMLAIRCSVEGVSIRRDEFVANVMDKRLVANFLRRDRQGGWVVKLLDPSNAKLSAKENLSPVESFDELEVGSGTTENVIVSWAVSPSELYLQLGLQLQAFKKNMKQMQDYYERLSQSELVETNLLKNRPVVAKFSQDEAWYRGEVIEKRGANVMVMFVDYGNKEVCPSSSVKRIEPSFMFLPKLALLCKLDGIQSLQSTWSSDLLEKYFSSDNTRATFKGKAGKKLIVSIENEKGDIAEQLVADGLAKRIQALKYVSRTLPEAGVQVDVFVCFVKSCSKFWVQILDDDGQLDDLQGKLEDVYSQGDAELIDVEGEACAAKYQEDESWYRGIIKKKNSNGSISVYFVDYGNTEEISDSEVKKLSNDLMELPTQAVEARAVGWEDSSSETFKDLTDQKEFSARIETAINGKITLTLFSNGHELLPSQAAETEKKQPKKREASPPRQVKTSQSLREVQVCYTETPNKFWYQNCETKESFDCMMDELEKYMTVEEREALKNTEVGELCAAVSSTDGGWYRAKVMKADGEVVSLFFIDYGNSEESAKDGLKELPQQFRDLLPVANEGSLNVGPVGETWSEEAILNFKDIVEGEGVTLNAAIVADGSLTQLRDKENRDVASLMIKSGYAVAKVASMLPKMSVPIGPRIKVFTSYFVSPSEFYVQMETQSDVLDRITETLEAGWESLAVVDATSLFVGYIGAAKSSDDEAWYRAQVQEVGKSGVSIFFVDFGNSGSCTKEEVRCLSKDLLDIPPLAIRCQLEDSMEYEEAEKKLADDSTEYEVVFKEDNGKFSVSLAGEESAKVDESDIVEALAAFDSKNLEIGFAYVSHANNPSDFYIQLENDTSVLEDLAMALEDHYGQHKDSGTVSDNGLAAVQSIADEGWYRAQILGKEDGNVNVLFVDYGNCESVPSTKVKPLVKCFGDKAVLAVQCCLAHVQSTDGDTWTEESVSKFSELCLDKPLRVSVVKKEQSKLVVDLKVGDEDVGELLICTGVAIKEEVAGVESEEQVTSKEEKATDPKAPQTQDIATVVSEADAEISASIADINETTLTCPYKLCVVEGGKVCGGISHIESPSDFWIQLENQSNKLKDLERKLEEYYNTERDTQRNLNEACAVIYGECEEARYYRCRVLSSEGQSAKVLFIDYGNEESVHVEEIKELPAHLTEDPMYAVHCKLPVESVTEGWTLAACDRFEEMSDVGDRLLTVQFREKDEADGKWCVHLLDMGIKLADTMVQEGYCTYKQQHQLVGDALDDKSIEPDSTLDTSLEDISAVDIAVYSTPVKSSAEYKEADIPLNRQYGGIISHYDSPRSFWVQLIDQSSALADLRNQINNHYLMNEPNILQDFSKPCAAVYADNGDGNLYFRAQVLSVEDNTVRVFFVDHGNSIEVSKKCVFELPIDLLKEPVHAIHCRLPLEPMDSSDWTEDALEAFEELACPGLKELIIEFKEKDGKVVLVDVFDEGVDIAATMIEKEFAKLEPCKKLDESLEEGEIRDDSDDECIKSKETEKKVLEDSFNQETEERLSSDEHHQSSNDIGYKESESAISLDHSLEEGEIESSFPAEVEKCFQEGEVLEDSNEDQEIQKSVSSDKHNQSSDDVEYKESGSAISLDHSLEEGEIEGDFPAEDEKCIKEKEEVLEHSNKEDQNADEQHDAECKDIENKSTYLNAFLEDKLLAEAIKEGGREEVSDAVDSNGDCDEEMDQVKSTSDTKSTEIEEKITSDGSANEGEFTDSLQFQTEKPIDDVLCGEGKHINFVASENSAEKDIEKGEEVGVIDEEKEAVKVGESEETLIVHNESKYDTENSAEMSNVSDDYNEENVTVIEVTKNMDASKESKLVEDLDHKESEGFPQDYKPSQFESKNHIHSPAEVMNESDDHNEGNVTVIEVTNNIETSEDALKSESKSPEDLIDDKADRNDEVPQVNHVTVKEISGEAQQVCTAEVEEITLTETSESLPVDSSSNTDLSSSRDIIEENESDDDSGRVSPLPQLLDIRAQKGSTTNDNEENTSDSEEFADAEDSGKEDTSLPPYRYSLDESFTATVLDCSSPWDFLCQMDGVDQLEQNLKETYEGSEEQVHDWLLSNACSVSSSDQGEIVWRRGLITGRPAEGKIQVYLVDHGVSGEVSINTLRGLPIEMLDHPVKAVKCALSSITPRNSAEWDMDSCARLQELVDKKEITLKVTHQGSKIVNPGNTVSVEAIKGGKNITELLVESGYASFIPVTTEE